MSNSPSYLDKLQLKIKTKLNKHIDNAHQNIRLNTNSNDDSKKNDNNSVKQNKPINNISWLKVWGLNFAIGMPIVILIFSINASIRYIIKTAKTVHYPDPGGVRNVLDIWFPSKCEKYPYGNEKGDPCGGCKTESCNGLTAQKLEKINKDIDRAEAQQKGGQSRTPHKMSGGDGNVNWLKDLINRVALGPKNPKNPNLPPENPEFPYNFYENEDNLKKEDNLKNEDNLKKEDNSKCGSSAFEGHIFRSYLNWIIRSLALTNISLYSNFKKLLTKLDELTERCELLTDILLLFCGSLLLLILPIIFVYSLCGNIWHQWLDAIKLVGGFFSGENFGVVFLIFLTILPINFGLDIIFALWALISMLIKIIVYPLLTNFKKVIIELDGVKSIMAFIVCGVIMVSLWSSPIQQGIGSDAALVFRIVTISVFIIISIIGNFRNIYKIWQTCFRKTNVPELETEMGVLKSSG